jgi:hypothetical protein
MSCPFHGRDGGVTSEQWTVVSGQKNSGRLAILKKTPIESITYAMKPR